MKYQVFSYSEKSDRGIFKCEDVFKRYLYCELWRYHFYLHILPILSLLIKYLNGHYFIDYNIINNSRQLEGIQLYGQLYLVMFMVSLLTRSLRSVVREIINTHGRVISSVLFTYNQTQHKATDILPNFIYIV